MSSTVFKAWGKRSMAVEPDEEEWKDEDFLSFEDNDEDPENDDLAEVNSSRGGRVLTPQELPPWMDEYTDFRRCSPLVALHNEVVGFCQLMSPLPEVCADQDFFVPVLVQYILFFLFTHLLSLFTQSKGNEPEKRTSRSFQSPGPQDLWS